MTEQELFNLEADDLSVSEADILDKNTYIPLTVGVKLPVKDAEYYNSIESMSLNGLPLVVALISTVVKVGVEVTTKVMSENAERKRAEEAIRMQRAKNNLHKDIKEYVKRCVNSYSDYVGKKEESYVALQYALNEYLDTGKYLSGRNTEILESLKTIYIRDMTSDSNGYEIYNRLFYRNGFDGSTQVLNDEIQSIYSTYTDEERVKDIMLLISEKNPFLKKSSDGYSDKFLDVKNLVENYNLSLSYYGLSLIEGDDGIYNIDWFKAYMKSVGGSKSIKVKGSYFAYKDVIGQKKHTEWQAGRYEDTYSKTYTETIKSSYIQGLPNSNVSDIRSINEDSVSFRGDMSLLYTGAREAYREAAFYKFYNIVSSSFKSDIIWAIVSGVPPWIIRAYINGEDYHSVGVSEAKVDCSAIDKYINSIIDLRRTEFENLIKEKEIEYEIDNISIAEKENIISLQESHYQRAQAEGKAKALEAKAKAEHEKAIRESLTAVDKMIDKKIDGTSGNPVKERSFIVKFLDNNKMPIGFGLAGLYLLGGKN